MAEVIIFGGGETALLAYEYFTHDSDYQVIAFAMDKEYIKEQEIYGLPVIDIDDAEKKYPVDKYKGFVAASSTKLNRVRRDLYNRVKSKGYQLVSYVSSKAFVWHNVIIGDNCFILEDNTLQPFTEVGNNVVMWSGNHLGHRSVINDHCFIASHCVISGFCEIGESSFIGVNATLENDVRIGEDNFIGAGAIIRKNSVGKSFYQEAPTELAKVNTHKIFKVRND